MQKLAWHELLAVVLIIVGGLNWGLVGAFDFNLVSAILGVGMIAKIVYILVGVSAVYALAFVAKLKK